MYPAEETNACGVVCFYGAGSAAECTTFLDAATSQLCEHQTIVTMTTDPGYILRQGTLNRNTHLRRMPKMPMTGRLQEAKGVASGAPTDAGTSDNTDLIPCSLDAEGKNACVYLVHRRVSHLFF